MFVNRNKRIFVFSFAIMFVLILLTAIQPLGELAKAQNQSDLVKEIIARNEDGAISESNPIGRSEFYNLDILFNTFHGPFSEGQEIIIDNIVIPHSQSSRNDLLNQDFMVNNENLGLLS